MPTPMKDIPSAPRPITRSMAQLVAHPPHHSYENAKCFGCGARWSGGRVSIMEHADDCVFIAVSDSRR